MSQKTRTIQDIQVELSQACQELGFLQFQYEHELPTQIQKRINEIMSVKKELDKYQELEQNAQAKAQQDAIDKMKETSGLTTVPLTVTQ